MLEILLFVGLCLTFGVYRVLGCLFSLGAVVVVAIILLIIMGS